MLRFVRQRPQMSQRWLVLLFSAFIFACGTTHLMDIWTIWRADYGWQMVDKAATALILIATAIALWRQVPNALRLPTVQQLQAAIGALEAEVGRRRSAEQHIREPPVQWLIPADRQAEEMRILAGLAHGKTVPPFETNRRARDGGLVPVSVTISPIRDLTGRIVGGSKIARDIRSKLLADQSRLKAEQRESENRQVLEANRLKSLFLANMSHELRTPLNAIIGFAELLHAGAVPVESSKHQQFLGHIASSGHHLLQLINDVLDLSKVESGKFEFYPEPVDLPALVQGSLDVLHTAIQRKHLTVTTEIDPQLTDLALDPARLKQVLFNYLSNAIKFTPDRGRILLRASPAGQQHFRIEVEDTGIGIAAADLPRLFTEFQQLDSGHNKQHPGTGLGLALTRRLVAAQGGSTGVRSQLGVGSVFELLLPRRPSPLAAGAPDPAAAARWLVIEDDAGQGARLVQALSGQGIRADTAATGAAALLQHRRQRYDAITLDLQLPDQPGLAALAYLRRQAPGRLTPVMAMSIGPEPGLNATFVIADVLRKPLETQEVVRAIQGLGQLPQRPLRALVIDDDALAVVLMTTTLEDLGLQVAGELDARQALQHIRVAPPDLVLMDIQMPGIDGLDLTRRLKADPATRSIVVVAYTAYAMKGDEARLRSAGCDGYLAKPINVALFANQVRALLAAGVQAAGPGLPV